MGQKHSKLLHRVAYIIEYFTLEQQLTYEVISGIFCMLDLAFNEEFHELFHEYLTADLCSNFGNIPEVFQKLLHEYAVAQGGYSMEYSIACSCLLCFCSIFNGTL